MKLGTFEDLVATTVDLFREAHKQEGPETRFKAGCQVIDASIDQLAADAHISQREADRLKTEAFLSRSEFLQGDLFHSTTQEKSDRA